MPKIIQDFLDGIAGIPDKNSGGCLFFCYAFLLWLEKNGLPTDSFIITQYARHEESHKIEHNMNYVNGASPMSSSHFTCMYECIEFDAEGLPRDIWRLSYKRQKLNQIAEYGLNEAFCIDALKKGKWNTDFNRKQAIKTVKKNLGIDMGHVI